jgi:predicted PurR-regulated permease PerM
MTPRLTHDMQDVKFSIPPSRHTDNRQTAPIENYILQPTIIGKTAQLSGFTVLASVLAFGALFGLIGAIIGVPIAAGLQIIAEELTADRRARISAADAASE